MVIVPVISPTPATAACPVRLKLANAGIRGQYTYFCLGIRGQYTYFCLRTAAFAAEPTCESWTINGCSWPKGDKDHESREYLIKRQQATQSGHWENKSAPLNLCPLKLFDRQYLSTKSPFFTTHTGLLFNHYCQRLWIEQLHNLSLVRLVSMVILNISVVSLY